MTAPPPSAVMVPGGGVCVSAAVAREFAVIGRQVLEAAMRAAVAAGRPMPPALVDALEVMRQAALVDQRNRSGFASVSSRDDGRVVAEAGRVTVAEAAVVLGISPQAVRKALRDRRLVGEQRSSGEWVIDRAVVEAAFAAREAKIKKVG